MGWGPAVRHRVPARTSGTAQTAGHIPRATAPPPCDQAANKKTTLLIFFFQDQKFFFLIPEKCLQSCSDVCVLQERVLEWG